MIKALQASWPARQRSSCNLPVLCHILHEILV